MHAKDSYTAITTETATAEKKKFARLVLSLSVPKGFGYLFARDNSEKCILDELTKLFARTSTARELHPTSKLMALQMDEDTLDSHLIRAQLLHSELSGANFLKEVLSKLKFLEGLPQNERYKPFVLSLQASCSLPSFKDLLETIRSTFFAVIHDAF